MNKKEERSSSAEGKVRRGTVVRDVEREEQSSVLERQINFKEYGIVTGKELVDMNVKDVPSLVKSLLYKEGLAVISGPSDVGKSVLARQLAMDVVLGRTEFLGLQLTSKHQKAIYVSTEEMEDQLSFMINHNSYSDSEGDRLSNILFLLNTDYLENKLRNILKLNPVDLIVIDTFTDLYFGDLNMTNKVRSYLHQFKLISQEFGCLILFIHHPTKKSEHETPHKNNLLGSQGIEAKVRVVLDLRRTSSDHTIRQLLITKGNYFSDEVKRKGFKLKLNDDMTFSVVDPNYIPSSSKLADKMKDKELMIYRVHELQEQGYTCTQTADILQEEGYTISSSSVSNYRKQPRPAIQIPKEEMWMDESNNKPVIRLNK